MQTQFFISKKGQQLGPFELETILKMLDQDQCHWMDYIFCERQNDWLLLMDYPGLNEKFQQGFARKSGKKFVADPFLSNASNKIESESPEERRLKSKAWYLLKDGNNFGPFAKLDLIQMLQNKSAHEYDFVWKMGFESWKKISEIPDFSADEMKKLKDSRDLEVSEVFFRRRHQRAQYGCSLIVHNNKVVHKGRAIEIGAGGAGILLDHSAFAPGQTLYLHFQPGEGVPPFNAVCKIVNALPVKEPLQGTPMTKYGVMFTSISPNIRESIKSFTAAPKKSAAA